MLKIGLTGGIGSGKTTVSNLFSDLGIPVIDTDIIAHQLVNSDKTISSEIIKTFGNAVTDNDGNLERKKLSNLVFSKQEDKQKLEDILHPKIRATVIEKIQQIDTSNSVPPYLIVVIPLLIETNFAQIVDRNLIVMADEKKRIERIQQRDDRKMNEIHAIISTQTSDQERLAIADDIIENNNNINELYIKVKELHRKYSALALDQ